MKQNVEELSSDKGNIFAIFQILRNIFLKFSDKGIHNIFIFF